MRDFWLSLHELGLYLHTTLQTLLSFFSLHHYNLSELKIASLTRAWLELPSRHIRTKNLPQLNITWVVTQKHTLYKVIYIYHSITHSLQPSHWFYLVWIMHFKARSVCIGWIYHHHVHDPHHQNISMQQRTNGTSLRGKLYSFRCETKRTASCCTSVCLFCPQKSSRDHVGHV